jgi:UDP-N-acetylglucosamine--N-acetylmuramyl-(pentapeptide) pyrophosphoryl-undecaprenol N-acetylglucosamine transferase
MKIVVTGGGSGGHFYPLMAVAESIQKQAREQKLLEPRLYYVGPDPYNPKELFDRGIDFIKVTAGKRRINPKGFSRVRNFFDIFKMGFGCIAGLIKMFFLFPDVVFAKGGFAAFPVLFAARVLGIPVVIHESDSVPGRVNLWAGKFAKRVGVAFQEAAEYFDPKKVAYTGNPVRKDITLPLTVGAYEYLELDKDLPVIAVMGGSLGAKRINDVVIGSLPLLVERYQVIHQTGRSNIDIVKGMAKLALDGASHPERYKAVDYLNPMSMRMLAGIADVIISRSGSSLFEIALWGVPSIMIPITDSNGDHQRKNAFNYARSGAAVVIEEANLTPQILVNEITRIVNDRELHDRMSSEAKKFSRPDAGDIIAHEVLNIALSHEV